MLAANRFVSLFTKHIGLTVLSTRFTHRQSVGEPYTLPDGRKIRFEVATIEDAETVNELHVQCFVNQISMYDALGAFEQEFAPFFLASTIDSISKNGTILGFIGEQFVGAWANKYYTKDEIVQHYGRRAHPGEKPVFEMLPDYGDVYDSVPGTYRNEKMLKTLLITVEEQWGKFMPDDLAKLCVDEAVIVHDSLRRSRVSTEFLLRSQAWARKMGCNYTGGTAIAISSQRLVKKDGYKVCYTLPFNKFKVNGKCPIENTHDGTTGINVVIKKL